MSHEHLLGSNAPLVLLREACEAEIRDAYELTKDPHPEIRRLAGAILRESLAMHVELTKELQEGS